MQSSGNMKGKVKTKLYIKKIIINNQLFIMFKRFDVNWAIC